MMASHEMAADPTHDASPSSTDPLVVDDGVIGHVFYPVFPPDRHAEEVVAWLRVRTR
jgi:peroxiredoxin